MEENTFIKKIYLRIENGSFGFVTNEIHKIKESDILISEEEYNEFFEMQSRGSQFRLKEKIEQKSEMGLFDYVETFIPQAVVIHYVPTETEILKQEVETLKVEIKETNSKLDNILSLISNK